ncbi:AraC family transcriptional regulator [Brevundimonas sp. TWP1-2-1b1]|uniref:AraC family transcriptional regulator n=1 Tax=unclassified Brevundimonas TaxID=2622653 RepID=UPI003CF218EA
MIIQKSPIDPLSSVLGAIGFSVACSVRLTAGGDWALRFQPIALKFNAVRHGGCWLTLEGETPIRLESGDCFIVSGRPFVLASAPDLPAVDAAKVFGENGLSAVYGQGEDVAFLGGSVEFTDTGAGDLLNLLPPALVIRRGADGAGVMGWLLEQLDLEWREGQAGGQAACEDLLRLMFINALRSHLTQADEGALGWLAGLNDRPTAAALRAIHAEPARTWRLSELAQEAGLSRTGFAERFKTKVGRTPIEYATRWRMRVAARRLKDGRRSISNVAQELGFLSDSAFGAAFRRVYGVSPGSYRATHKASQGN